MHHFEEPASAKIIRSPRQQINKFMHKSRFGDDNAHPRMNLTLLGKILGDLLNEVRLLFTDRAHPQYSQRLSQHRDSKFVQLARFVEATKLRLVQIISYFELCTSGRRLSR